MMERTPPLQAQLLLDTRCVLGEGPVWEPRARILYWVDIEGYRLHAYRPGDRSHHQWPSEGMIGAAVPVGDGRLLLAEETGLTMFDVEKGEAESLGVLRNDDPFLRYNDGKVGPDGAFWIGSMHKGQEPHAGNLYRVSPTLQTTVKIENTSISNGMAWSADHRTFYFIDSPTHTIRAFDFDPSSGNISHERICITVPDHYGAPDGMCIDSQDHLWVAHWGGHCVRRWDPVEGRVMEEVRINAPHVTSCCFGGNDLKTLYITTARSGLSEADLHRFPESGGLFWFAPDVAGTSIHYFRCNTKESRTK